MPEALFDCLVEIEEAHRQAMADPEFWKEWESLYAYSNRPSNLYFAEQLTKHAGGAKIWLKREELYVTQCCAPNTVILTSDPQQPYRLSQDQQRFGSDPPRSPTR